MRRLILAVLVLFIAAGLWAQSPPAKPDDTTQLRQEVDHLKKTINALEQRLSAQEKSSQQALPAEKKDTISVPELHANVKELDERVVGQFEFQ